MCTSRRWGGEILTFLPHIPQPEMTALQPQCCVIRALQSGAGVGNVCLPNFNTTATCAFMSCGDKHYNQFPRELCHLDTCFQGPKKKCRVPVVLLMNETKLCFEAAKPIYLSSASMRRTQPPPICPCSGNSP